MAGIYPDYPPSLSREAEKYLLTNLKDWSLTHGLAVRTPPSYVPAGTDPAGALAITAPVTLFPSLFPRNCFDEALSLAQHYNELYSAIACDEQWLKGIVEELVQVDDFIAELWKVHLAVKAEGYVQRTELGIFRSDYMVHLDSKNSSAKPSIRQVEFNTIASSFAGISTQVSGLHRHLQCIDAYPEAITDASLPENDAASDLALGLSQAQECYSQGPVTGLDLCVIFLVQDPERNVFDQRHLEYRLNKWKVRTFRLAFDQILEHTKLDDERRLIYTPPSLPLKQFEVSLVYFRAGYAPAEYTSTQHWAARLQIERSAAIKCPSVLTQLAGTKKVQQVLATPHSPHLARFQPDSIAAAAIQRTFAPIYPLDNSEAGNVARHLATDPRTAVRYVLKPQREGGGNNVYRGAIPGFLQGLPQSHWPAYILMEMIEPPAQRNTIFRNGELQSGGVICELGVYGVCLWHASPPAEDGTPKRHITDNFKAGYLLRTKGDQSEEGGVAAGFGSVDSPCLVDV